MEQVAMNTIEMSRLTRAQQRDLEQDLRRERVRLERLMGAATAAGGQDHATAMSNDGAHMGLTALLHGRAAERYQAVLNALERMDNGGYGICVSCQQAIPFGRLMAMPEAAVCMACSARW